MKLFNTLLFLFAGFVHAQTYDSYFLGNSVDVDTVGQGGICMMGGASEDDNAMIWFLERANEGDVLVLRTSGSDGYNDYMLNQLGVNINSVETIVCNSAAASNETYLHQKIQEAEAVWFAGGDQWNYISYWRNTAIDSLINVGIQTRGLVVGGTSAGMAIQGQYYFSAENGTVTSAAAMANPYDSDVTVQNAPFIDHPILSNTITDTHYDDPDRKGRHMTFLARMVVDNNVTLAQGIACNEYTAVCIDENGMAKVYGGYPTYDEFAYFLRVNCGNIDTGSGPENCSTGVPLNWNRQQSAVQVYKLPGTAAANNHFNLNDWTDASGGSWETWWVDNGVLNEAPSSEINCQSALETVQNIELSVYPIPASGYIEVISPVDNCQVKLINLLGQPIIDQSIKGNNFIIDISEIKQGPYVLQLQNGEQLFSKKVLIKR